MTAPNRQLEKKPLYREEVKSALLDMILSGKLMPGERIVETKWAKEFGVSQSPIREAIRELEILGVVTTVPYKGSFVRKITRTEVIDAYRVRSMLENGAITDMVSLITSEQIETTGLILAKMREAAGQDDFRMYIGYDAMFHESFIEITPNNLLKKLWTQCNISGATQIGTQMSGESLLTLADRHVPIYEALANRDAAAAQTAIQMHFTLLIDELHEYKD